MENSYRSVAMGTRRETRHKYVKQSEMKHNSKNVTTRNPWTSYDALDDVPRVIGWKGELSH